MTSFYGPTPGHRTDAKDWHGVRKHPLSYVLCFLNLITGFHFLFCSSLIRFYDCLISSAARASTPTLKNADQAARGATLTEECSASLITETPAKNIAPSAQLTQKAVSVISLSARQVISPFCFTSATKGGIWFG